MTSTNKGAVRSGSYRAAVVEKKGGEFVLKALPFRQLRPNECLIRVEACGVCHSDSITKEGYAPIEYPRVPGHEVVGRIEETGSAVPASRGLSPGVRVGRGWHGGHCFGCGPCMQGDFILCKAQQVSGLSDDGGYGEFMYAPWESLAIVPESLSSVAAGPLMCAGITVFHSLRMARVPPPALVAVQGLGGLGHLAVQFAAKSGYEVAAVGRGSDKAAFAKELGASHWIDSTKGDAAEQLQRLGGAAVIISTATDAAAQSALLPGLGDNGVMLVVGISQQPIEVQSLQIISRRSRVQGWASGHALDSQHCMQFAAQHGIRTVTEEFSLEDAGRAYSKMMQGKAHFRAVIVPTATARAATEA